MKSAVLSIAHEWIKRISKKVKEVHVITIYLGKHELPENVKLYSLGKEKGLSKVFLIFNLFKYLTKLMLF